jgi:hypothetical protein
VIDEGLVARMIGFIKQKKYPKLQLVAVSALQL